MRRRNAASSSTRASAAANAAGSWRSTSSPSRPDVTISWVPGELGRDDRDAARHRFDEHVAEPFVARRQREDVGARHVAPGIAPKSAEVDTPAETTVCDERAHRRFLIALPQDEQRRRQSAAAGSRTPRSTADSSSLPQGGPRRRSPAAAIARRRSRRSAPVPRTRRPRHRPGLWTTRMRPGLPPNDAIRSSATPRDVATIRSAAAQPARMAAVNSRRFHGRDHR